MRIWRARHKFNLLEKVRKVFIINRKSKKKREKDINDASEIQRPYTSHMKENEVETNQMMRRNNIFAHQS
jgi:hypothetical protein